MEKYIYDKGYLIHVAPCSKQETKDTCVFKYFIRIMGFSHRFKQIELNARIFITEKTDRIRFLNDTFHNLEVIYQYLLERSSRVRSIPSFLAI